MAITNVSDPIRSVLTALSVRDETSQGMRAMMTRASEFPGVTEAQLAGIALDPRGRELADTLLDHFWAASRARLDLYGSRTREVIIGAGFHAAVYAATRVLSGFPRPLVVERSERVGGAFALASRPTFYLNSRNRAGSSGLAGDQGANLNYLPGAPIQASSVSRAEYQTNADMAFVIRLTLAQYADVITGVTVKSVSANGERVDIATEYGIARESLSFEAGRVIDARGIGDPSSQKLANGTTIVTFPQFLNRMNGMWPLRGLRRVAVVGGGDSGKCAVESFLGISPEPSMAAAGLDQVDRVDWYARDLPTTCDRWKSQVRGRYQAIGRYLKADRFGVRRLNVINRNAEPIALPDTALINGRTYDLIVMCTGNEESEINGLGSERFTPYVARPITEPIATEHVAFPAFRVGPHARLRFTAREEDDGIADISANAVSMFRTANKTAALAATLPAL